MALVAAQLLDWNHVANRLYYSAYYAVSALFVQQGINIKTHNGIRIKVHQELVKQNKLSLEFGGLYDELFNKRQEGDYGDFLIMPKEKTEPLIQETFEL